jgi:tetratricopeptide (TPR) repeat protein
LNPDDASNFQWFPQELLWESPPEVQQAFLDLATKAIALAPECSGNYQVRAYYYHHRGEHEKDIADLDAALALSPQDAELYSTRSFAHLQHGEYEHALADLNQLNALSADNSTIHYFRAPVHGAATLAATGARAMRC